MAIEQVANLGISCLALDLFPKASGNRLA